MLSSRRRIITGHDAQGKSRIVIDGPPGNLIERNAGGLAEIWNTDGGPVDSRDAADRASGPVHLSPPAGGSRCRWFQIAPDDPAISTAELEANTAQAFAAIGAAHERPDTSRDPRIHKTPSVDYIVLLSGRVTLLLDDDECELQPCDVVVQRGTNHAWINRGDEPALLVAVLIDSDIT